MQGSETQLVHYLVKMLVGGIEQLKFSLQLFVLLKLETILMVKLYIHQNYHEQVKLSGKYVFLCKRFDVLSFTDV